MGIQFSCAIASGFASWVGNCINESKGLERTVDASWFKAVGPLIRLVESFEVADKL